MRKSMRARRKAQSMAGLCPSSATRTRVFRTQPEGRTDIHLAHRYSLRAELTLLRLVPAEIRNHRGRETGVNRP
jgi:hypothetical protein